MDDEKQNLQSATPLNSNSEILIPFSPKNSYGDNYDSSASAKSAAGRKKTVKKLWKNIELGDVFPDGSKVTEIHEVAELNCYRVFTRNSSHITPIKNFLARNLLNSDLTEEMILSEDHVLLVSARGLSKDIRESLITSLGSRMMPKAYDRFVRIDEIGDVHEDLQVVDWDPSVNLTPTGKLKSVWLTVDLINTLLTMGQRIYCGDKEIIRTEFIPKKIECFCVSTDTGRYKTNGLIHHNSVTLRNIIIHCLTHSDDIVVALVDLKQTEFTGYRGARGVVGVATTIEQALELCRLARQTMYFRNKEMAKLGIANIMHYKPTKPTGKISIFGREFDENQEFPVMVNDVEKTMTALEIYEYLNSRAGKPQSADNDDNSNENEINKPKKTKKPKKEKSGKGLFKK